MKRNGKPTRREIELGAMRAAGYRDDRRTYVRLLVERRTASRAALEAAWRAGENLRIRESLRSALDDWQSATPAQQRQALDSAAALAGRGA